MTRRNLYGWIAVAFSTLASSLWAMWGMVENFHEGWYYHSTWLNLAMMFVQYLSPTIIIMAITLIALRWPKVGSFVYIAAGLLFSVLIFTSFDNLRLTDILSWLPVTGFLGLVGFFFWIGRPVPLKRAFLVTVAFPLILVIAIGIPSFFKVVNRFNDHNFDMRFVEGNKVRLAWAPSGPGWPREGKEKFNWEKARNQCSHLSSDGTTLLEEVQDIWRLPAVEEVVGSLTRKNENAGGVWDAENQRVSYTVSPDKETPLWDSYSMVVYWWTDTEVNAEKAFRVAYNGDVVAYPKNLSPNYLAFRCVKDF